MKGVKIWFVSILNLSQIEQSVKFIPFQLKDKGLSYLNFCYLISNYAILHDIKIIRNVSCFLN